MRTNLPVLSRSAATLVIGLLLSFKPGLCGENHAANPTVDAVAAYAKLDYAKALELLTPLAGQRDEIAQLLLGRMYSQGEGVVANAFTALELYRGAAEQGNTDAQFELAPPRRSQRRSDDLTGGVCRRVPEPKDRDCTTGATSNWPISKAKNPTITAKSFGPEAC